MSILIEKDAMQNSGFTGFNYARIHQIGKMVYSFWKDLPEKLPNVMCTVRCAKFYGLSMNYFMQAIDRRRTKKGFWK
jgi:hypothetical protein